MVFKYNPHFVVLWCTGGAIRTRKWPNPEKVIQRVLPYSIPPALMLVSAAKGQVFRVRMFHSRFTELPNTDLSCTNAPTRVTNFQHGSLGVTLFGKGWRFKDISHSQVLYICAFPICTKLAWMEYPWIQNTCTSVRFCIFWMNELVMGVWMVEYDWNTSFFQY